MTKCDDSGEIASIKQSLQDRLNALKTNQESWKNRINKNNEPDINNRLIKERISIDENIFKKNETQNDKLNKKLNANKLPAPKLADRLLSLEKSAIQWKNRVADKDNHKFTISGKMASIDYTVNNNLNIDKLTSGPKIELTKGNLKKDSTNGLAKKKLTTNGQSTYQPKNSSNLTTSKPTNISKNESTESSPRKLSIEKKVEIPKIDSSLDTFFKPVKLEKIVSPNKEEVDDFFSELDQSNSNLLVIKKDVKIKNRKSPSTKNPLKKMQNSTNLIQDSYSQLDTYQSESYKNQAIIKPNQFNSTKISSTIRKDLDPTAKAGLESKEDYKSVANKLKKSTNNQEHLNSNNLLPNKSSKYLIQVKGRKKIQVRLVDPIQESINEGDSFVLITNDLVIVWLGEFTNIIERRKALELGNKIYKRKELGFINGNLITIDNDKKSVLNHNDINTFKNLISSTRSKFNSAGNEEEDEFYENQIIKTNKVFIFDNDKFNFNEQMSSKQLYQQQLNPYDAFLFDFGTEVYVWLGFHLSNENRNLAIELAQDHYSKTDRPEYSILYKCNQNMELILFQEKFFGDWIPNYKHKAKSSNGGLDKRMNLKMFNVAEMMKKPEEIDLILDNTHIGRGDYYEDKNELMFIEIVTDNVKCWHVNEYEKKEIKNKDLGQFFDTETYVVRWEYRINRLGNLEKKKSIDKSSDEKSDDKLCNNKEDNIFKKAERINFKKHKETLDNNVTGRERFCYFYWQGSNSSIANKGAAALMAIELDKEKGTQIQINQSEEPPCFLRLFKGRFVIFNNKCHPELTSSSANKDQLNYQTNRPNRLFLVKGVYSEEAFLYEVKCDVSSLRSKGCFVLVDFKVQIAYLWIGKSASQDQIKIANEVCENISKHSFSMLSQNALSSFKFTIQTVKQSFEIYEFLKHLNYYNQSLSQIKSTIKNLINYSLNDELIICSLSSLSGEFTFKRLQCTYSSNDRINNFPFEQTQLYSVTQPAFFLVDNGEIVFLWQGCVTKPDDLVGSIQVRYSQEKKVALETVLSYCNSK